MILHGILLKLASGRQLEELVNEWGQDSERGWLRRYRDSDQDQSALQRFSDGIHNALDMFHVSY